MLDLNKNLLLKINKDVIIKLNDVINENKKINTQFIKNSSK